MTKPLASAPDAVRLAYRAGTEAAKAGAPERPRPHYPTSAERHAWSVGWNDMIATVAWRETDEVGV